MPDGVLSITCESFGSVLRRRLLRGTARLRPPVDLREERLGESTVFHLRFPEGRRDRVVEAVAEAIADTVMCDWEPRFVEAILAERLPALIEEGGRYLTPALRELLEPRQRPDAGWHRRREEVAAEIESFLAEEDHLVIEGFLSFRVHRYRRALEQKVDRAALPWIEGRAGPGPGIDDEEMDLVFRPDGLAFLSDAADNVLIRGWVEDDELSDFVLRYLLAHRVPCLTVHDPADWWGSWPGAVKLPAFLDDLDACFGCPLCLGVRSSR